MAIENVDKSGALVVVAEFKAAERAFLAEQGLRMSAHRVPWASADDTLRILQTGEGPPLLYVHGGGGFAVQWAPLVSRLPAFRHILVNRPGCGGSTPFDYRGADLRRHANAVLDSVFEWLDVEHAPIVANSMGALWSLWYSIDRPDRVQALVLLGDPAGLLHGSAPVGFRLMGVRGLNRVLFSLQRPSRANAQRVISRVYGRPAAQRIPSSYVELEYRASSLAGTPETFRTLLENTVRLRGMRPGAGAGSEDLCKVRQPTLFVWGEHDVFASPEVGRRACKIMPDADIEIVDGVHLPWWDDSDRCARSVEAFLRDHAGDP